MKSMNEGDYDFGLDKKISEYSTKKLVHVYKKLKSSFATLPGAKKQYPMVFKKLDKIKAEIDSRKEGGL